MSEHEEFAVQVAQIKQYHKATKHFPNAYAKGPGSLDWDAQPNPFRKFAGAPTTTLPLLADELSLPFTALYSQQPLKAAPLNLDSLAVLLEISLAISAWKHYGTATWALRCNPSSGNLHPTEAYVIAANIQGLDDGIYHYCAKEHALELRCLFTPSTNPNRQPQLLVGLSSVHWREAWKYGERAYRYCQLDVGHALGAISYAAAVLGWPVQLLQSPSTEQLSQLFGVNRQQDFGPAEAEHADALIQLWPSAKSPAAILTNEHAEVLTHWLARAEAGVWSGVANVLDRRHFYSWPIIDQVAAACVKPETANLEPSPLDMPPDARPVLPPPRALECAEPASKVIRQRRSAQAFDRVTPIALADFFTLLDHLLPRPEQAPFNLSPAPGRVHIVLFVHRVTDLTPGLYALPRSASGQALMQATFKPEFKWQKETRAPAHLPLYHLITGNAERMAARLSCQQAIASDSAFALAMLAEFNAPLESTPWRYNELYQEAGLIGQALYLDAEAIGLRGTGIGCFFDDGVHDVLGIQSDTLQSLYHFTVGGPIVDTRIVSLPPYSNR